MATTSATTTGTTSATTSATTQATTTGTTCPLAITPGTVPIGGACCEDADCVTTGSLSKYIVPLVSNVLFSLSVLSI